MDVKSLLLGRYRSNFIGFQIRISAFEILHFADVELLILVILEE